MGIFASHELTYALCPVCSLLPGGEDSAAILKVHTVKVSVTEMTKDSDTNVMGINSGYRFGLFLSLTLLLLLNSQIIICYQA